MPSPIHNRIFHSDEAARLWLEAKLWPNGPICPHCGTVDDATLMRGKSHRPGLYQCNACREPFTVTVGTLYERSHIPLHKWLLVTHLLMASKKGISAKQIERMLGLSYKSAWFMCHRIRESLRGNDGAEPLGGAGKRVEADETYIGGKEKNKHLSKREKYGYKLAGPVGKEAAFALVERDGRVRSFHVPAVNSATLREILSAHIDHGSILVTDELGGYKRAGRQFAAHETVHHTIGEYVRGDAHTNTVEGYFSILKRGIVGVYHHISQQHLKRYLAEFDFRYNEREKLGVDDEQRFARSIPGIVGKRLTYRRTNDQESGQGGGTPIGPVPPNNSLGGP